ncbi:MAG TPA: hypothetical protein VMV04_01795, partial [Thermodesulfobacteriota bacterium]|nr:hypothetical protein [Thermodesulfobacteriota bacterium]
CHISRTDRMKAMKSSFIFVLLWAYPYCLFVVVIYAFFEIYGSEEYRKEERREGEAKQSLETATPACRNFILLRISYSSTPACRHVPRIKCGVLAMTALELSKQTI